MTISLRNSINEKCKDCIYDPKSGLGAWRQQVEACTMEDCPLYKCRPRSRTRSLDTEKGPQPEGLAKWRKEKSALRKSTTD